MDGNKGDSLMIDITKSYRTINGNIVVDIRILEDNPLIIFAVLDLNKQYCIVKWNIETGKACFPLKSEFDLVVK